MIRVKFKPPVGNPHWDRWVSDATAETRALVANGEPYKFKGPLYKKMRRVIFDAFHGKCAYCEAKFILTETGDVEHFRPKGAVTDELGKPVLRSEQESKKKHPGYYWLAYHWENLLPSCSKCNRPNKTRDGRTVGKGTKFPVLRSRKFPRGWARREDEVALERPVFIHPIKENPGTHLKFDRDHGVLAGKTGRGQLCIELLGLNREGLPERRKEIYLSTIANLSFAISEWEAGRPAEFLDRLKIINSYKDGTDHYSLAGREALASRPDLLEKLERILDSLP